MTYRNGTMYCERYTKYYNYKDNHMTRHMALHLLLTNDVAHNTTFWGLLNGKATACWWFSNDNFASV